MITTTTSTASYTATAGQTVFTYPFRIQSESDLLVFSETTLGVRSDITSSIVSVSGVDNEAGGSVTLPAQAVGTTIYLIRASTFSQLWDASALNFFDPSTVERVVDKLTILIQEIKTDVGSCLRLTLGENIATLDKEARKGKLVQFNSVTGELELAASALDAAAQSAISAASALSSANSATASALAASISAGTASSASVAAAVSADTALAAISSAYKGDLAGGSVPATSTAAGDTYRITSAGTSQGKTWGIGDVAIYKGTSGQWTQLTGFYNAAYIVVTPVGDLAATNLQAALTELDSEKVALAGFFNPANRILNGNFSRNQTGQTSVVDAAYHMDQWYALTESGSVTVAQQTDQEAGQATNLRLTQPDVTGKRIGSAQAILSLDCRDLRSQTAFFRARVRCSASQAIRWAVIEHTGTNDVVTKDVVADWTNASFTAGGFFISSNTVIAATGSVTPLVNTWTDILGSAAISTACDNILVFIWTEAVLAQNGTLDIGSVKLARGVQSPFEPRPASIEAQLCNTFFIRLKNSGASAGPFGNGYSHATSTARVVFNYPEMRTTPTVTVSTPSHFSILDSSGNIACTGSSTLSASKTSALLTFTSAPTQTVGRGILVSDAGSGLAFVDVDARL